METIRSMQFETFDMISYRELGSCSYTGDVMAANRKHLLTLIFSSGEVFDVPTHEAATIVQSGVRPWQELY